MYTRSSSHAHEFLAHEAYFITSPTASFLYSRHIHGRSAQDSLPTQWTWFADHFVRTNITAAHVSTRLENKIGGSLFETNSTLCLYVIVFQSHILLLYCASVDYCIGIEFVDPSLE